MAQIFAKSLYNSAVWKRCRTAYIKSVHYLCERCGEPGEELHHKIRLTIENINDPDVTLNWENLEYLCFRCHQKETFNRKGAYLPGLAFDNEGNMKQIKAHVVIVWGAPASGKTTYVKQVKKPIDIVWDFDYVLNALYLGDRPWEHDAGMIVMMPIREAFYQAIKGIYNEDITVWIIGTLPKRRDREVLRSMFDAEMIHISITKDEAIDRVMNDDNRINKPYQKMIIDKYFNELEP